MIERIKIKGGGTVILRNPKNLTARVLGPVVTGMDNESGDLHIIGQDMIASRTEVVHDPVTGDLVTVATARESEKHHIHVIKNEGSKRDCPCRDCRKWVRDLKKLGLL